MLVRMGCLLLVLATGGKTVSDVVCHPVRLILEWWVLSLVPQTLTAEK